MGAAQSSNTSDVIGNIANFVNNSTTVNSNAVNEVQNNIALNECKIKYGDTFNVQTSSTTIQKNNQIVKAKQDSNLNNNIQQKMLQESLSQVGSLGLGFSNAHNSATVIANSSNEIINAMNVGCTQNSTIHNNFNCNNSTILAKNVNISYDSYSNFLSSQTLKNDQVANIVNDITQTVEQKATATLEGISGMILMLLLAIAVLIYVALKPLSSGSAKMIVGVIMSFLIVFILIGMYIRGTPPFFSDLDECINNSSLGRGSADCINTTKKRINMSNPPIKYLYGITPYDRSQPGANLVQMSIASKSGQTNSSGINGGYRGDTFNTLENTLQNYKNYAVNLNIPMIPNPLYVPTQSKDNGIYYYIIPGEYSGNSPNIGNNGICTPGTIQVGIDTSEKNIKNCPQFASPSAFETTTNFGTGERLVANLNISDWQDYINMTGKYPPTSNFQGDEIVIRALFARFVLCDIIGNIELHYYMSDYEYVKFLDKYNNNIVILAKDAKNQYPSDVYMYHAYTLPGKWSDGIISTGYIYGNAGYVDNTNYRYQTFMRNIGLYICIGILLLIFGFMFFIWYKNK